MKGIQNKLLLTLLLVMSISIIYIGYVALKDNNIVLDEVSLKESINNKDAFAIMVQQKDKTYQESESSVWPTEGYIYNQTLSGCIDARGEKVENALIYDKANQVANVSVNGTTYCYLYFDLEGEAYAIYSEDDTSLRFYKNIDEVEVGDTYNNRVVTAVYTGIEDDTYSTAPWNSYKSVITEVVVEEEIKPKGITAWFNDMTYVSSLDLTKLNTSKVTSMENLFYQTGSSTTTFEIKGLDNWNTSNVTNMVGMFKGAGKAATSWYIGNLSAKTAVKEDGSLYDAWNTSKVTSISGMFNNAGYNAINFVLDLSGWDLSQVISLANMFENAGLKSQKFEIKNLSTWDISTVKSLSLMFAQSGMSATEWNVGDLSNWNTCNVTDMGMMFEGAGANSQNFKLDLSKWDTKNAKNMISMFKNAGSNSTKWSVGDLSTKEITKDDGATYMAWDVSKVSNMTNMFFAAGVKANYTLDLTSWNPINVTSYEGFNKFVTAKVIAPSWVNSAS